jgi:2-phospho-L-lactate guanylyltransferase
MIVVAVPVKDLTSAKQRLTPALSARQRAELAAAMLDDVLRAVLAAPVDAVWVVTREPQVATVARRLGAEILSEPANEGHTAAVARAQAEARRRGVSTFLTVPGDVPCVRPAEIAVLAAAAAKARAAVFVPSRSGAGTNGVALTPPHAMPLTFGEPSFANHLATAHRHGLEPCVLALSGLSLDIDDPDDLHMLMTDGRQTDSGRLLAAWGQGRPSWRDAVPAAVD